MLLSCAPSAQRTWSMPQELYFLSHSNPRIKSHSRSIPIITCSLTLGFEDVAAVAHNKVLVAAAFSGAIGQLLKPVTSVLLYRKPFSLKAAVQAGGFPSTHSSTVVATALSLGLDRGFSDSVFGLAVVYASLVMYDAQGVRREVGKHAKTINKFMIRRKTGSAMKEDELMGSQAFQLQNFGPRLLEESSGHQEEKAVSSIARGSTQCSMKADMDRELTVSPIVSDHEIGSFNSLNESVGHTELEVIAGAALGFFVSLVVYYQI